MHGNTDKHRLPVLRNVSVEVQANRAITRAVLRFEDVDTFKAISHLTMAKRNGSSSAFHCRGHSNVCPLLAGGALGQLPNSNSSSVCQQIYISDNLAFDPQYAYSRPRRLQYPPDPVYLTGGQPTPTIAWVRTSNCIIETRSPLFFQYVNLL